MAGSEARSDEDEFRVFVAAQGRPLFSLAFLLTRDRGAAEDLVQNAFAATYARWPQLRGQSPVAYARRVVANGSTDRWRRSRGREVLTDTPPEGEGEPVEAGVAERDAVLRTLDELSSQERRVVVLRFLCDLSEADTAETLGIPRGTVKSVTSRAVAKLRTSPHLTGTSSEVTR
jgi:RNA polymerase sigma-70 factor (sigma-E family)